jgi:hypothetical protein
VTEASSGSVLPAWCEHEAGGHEDGAPSAATAPAGARAWLLIECDGPWAAEATETALPTPLAKLALSADELGIRVQLIRRPAGAGRAERAGRAVGDGGPGDGTPEADGNRVRAEGGPGGGARGENRRRDGVRVPVVFAAWTGGRAPWVRRVDVGDLGPEALTAIAAGQAPGGAASSGPLFLVCAHGRRDRCCARFGVPLARELAGAYPAGVWESTHVGGHRFAANLVILPHGLYYGPVDAAAARDAIGAYARGEITARGYRGRAGQPVEAQRADCEAVTSAGTLPL